MKSFLIILLLVSYSSAVLGIDKMFNFKKQYLPENVEFEKERKLCFFPFRGNLEDKKTSYLSNGMPSVLLSGLNGLQYVYDEDVMANVITHEYGEKRFAKSVKDTTNFNTLKELNEGKKEVIAEKDPRFITLKSVFIQTDTPVFLESALELGKKNGCFYIITGEYSSTGEDSIQYKAELTQRRNGKVENFPGATSLRRGYQEMTITSDAIKKYLIGKEATTIEVDTKTEEGAFVFIDGYLLGKTPLVKNDVPIGKHILTVSKDGFEKAKQEIHLKKGITVKYSFPLIALRKDSAITVHSEPEGATVYLGGNYLGETPLENVKVPAGQNRLRVSKEGYIEHFKGLEFEPGKTTLAEVKLKEGDTETYYKNESNVFLDYKYSDFGNYSIMAAFMFYVTFGYNYYMVSKTRDDLRNDVRTTITFYNVLNSNLNSATTPDAVALAQTTSIGGYLYEKYRVDQNEKLVNHYMTYRNASALGVGLMLIASGIFFYFDLSTESFEFAITPTRPDIYSFQPGVESSFRYSFKF